MSSSEHYAYGFATARAFIVRRAETTVTAGLGWICARQGQLIGWVGVQLGG